MKKLVVLLGLFLFSILSIAEARDWFISAERGGGREGSIEKPAKDLGNIISRLEAHDRIFIAGGTYLGRAENGVDSIEIPVEIYGGWNEDFNLRDPWGEFKTIFTGVHNSQNFSTDYRLSIDTSRFATPLMEARGEETEHRIVVDGVWFDNGPRNYYSDESESLLIRKGTASDTPSPESGGMTISTGINGDIVVENCIVMNTAPTQGAFAFFPGKNGKVTVNNNMAVNNTGIGFHLSSSTATADASSMPQYEFKNNISVFNEKHDPFATYGGSSVAMESSVKVVMTGNVLGMNDYYAIDNAKRSQGIIMTHNLMFGNAIADYLEFDTKMDLEDIVDWSDLVDDVSGNRKELVQLNVSEDWVAKYMARAVIDRNAAEEDVQAVDSWQNDVRSIFGLNLVGNDLSVDSAVWLPRISIDDVLAVAGPYLDQYGASIPAPSSGQP